MNISPKASPVTREFAPRSPLPPRLGGLLVAFMSLSLLLSVGRAQSSGEDGQEGQVLTRGPVHEAFAGMISYNPEPGMIVKITPPDNIEEIPPTEKPEGDEVAWIPGYWAWDDERNDFLSISGTWRRPPPGRDWVAGYSRDTGQGISGFQGIGPRPTLGRPLICRHRPRPWKSGPISTRPSSDYGWTPGCSIWRDNRYAWRAGYWAEGRADWIWIPPLMSGRRAELFLSTAFGTIPWDAAEFCLRRFITSPVTMPGAVTSIPRVL